MIELIRSNDVDGILKIVDYMVILVKDESKILEEVVEANLNRIALKNPKLGVYVMELDEFNNYLLCKKKKKINYGSIYILNNNAINSMPFFMRTSKINEYIC